MAEKDEKISLGDALKKVLGGAKKEETPPVVATPKATPVKKPVAKAKAGSMSDGLAGAGAEGKVDAFIEKRKALTEAELKKQEEILHTKTHQDLVNAVYKVADELKVKGGPWPMLRAAGWGHFTDDRGKKYDGPAIDKIDGFDPAQKAALKKVLGIK